MVKMVSYYHKMMIMYFIFQLLSVSDGRCLDTLSSKNRSPMGLYQCVSKAISTQVRRKHVVT